MSYMFIEDRARRAWPSAALLGVLAGPNSSYMQPNNLTLYLAGLVGLMQPTKCAVSCWIMKSRR